MTTHQSTLALARILQLEPNSHTCIGYARTTGRRCQCPIAYAARQEAAEVLLDVVRMDPQSPRLDVRLEQLASLHLCINCNNRHQDQVAAITRQWLQDIRNEPRQRITPGSHSPSQQREPTNHQADSPPPAPSTVEPTSHTTAPSIEPEQTATTEEAHQEPTSPIPSSPTQTPHPQRQDSDPAHCDCTHTRCVGCGTLWFRARCRRNFHPDGIVLWRASREADERETLVRIVARSGPTEMVLLLLLCCVGDARVLLALVVWVLILVTRVAVVRA